MLMSALRDNRSQESVGNPKSGLMPRKEKAGRLNMQKRKKKKKKKKEKTQPTNQLHIAYNKESRAC